MESKISFLSVDFKSDVPTCKIVSKNSSLKCWLCYRLFLKQRKNHFRLALLSLVNEAINFIEETTLYYAKTTCVIVMIG